MLTNILLYTDMPINLAALIIYVQLLCAVDAICQANVTESCHAIQSPKYCYNDIASIISMSCNIELTGTAELLKVCSCNGISTIPAKYNTH